MIWYLLITYILGGICMFLFGPRMVKEGGFVAQVLVILMFLASPVMIPVYIFHVVFVKLK